MIRHFDGTNDCAMKISAQSKRGKIVALVWSWKKHRIFLTQDAATDSLKRWKRWYEERLGWEITGSMSKGYVATSPDGVQHSVVLHTYDARTRIRL